MTTRRCISPAAEALARTACEELFLDFHSYIDAGVATRGLELFDNDGVFEVRGQRHEGRPALAAFLEAREAASDRRTRHLASNFCFTLDTADRAHATANLTLFTVGGEDGIALELEAVVDCELTFILRDQGWRINSRRHVRFATAAT